MKESNSIDKKKERIRLSRIGVLNSHLSSDPMASEKEAAPAAVPSDSPTTYSRRQLIKKPYHLFFFECPVKTVFCLVVLAS